MHRLRSIRARILGGFIAVLLLQLGMAVAVWHAEDRVERAVTADAAAVAVSRQLNAVSSALHATQLRLADYLRTGGALERDGVNQALAAMGESAGTLEGGDTGMASLGGAIAQVRTALGAVMAAAQAKRDAAISILQTVVTTQNGLFALGQAVAHAPDHETEAAAAAALAASAPPLTAGTRYALTEDPNDAGIAAASAQRAKEMLGTMLQSGSDVPARVQRLSGIVAKSLSTLEPSIARLDQAAAARGRSLTELGGAIEAANASLTAADERIDAERQQRREETAAARGGVRTTLLAGASIACLLGLGLAFLVGISITRPVGRLGVAMRRIADGVLDLEVPDRHRRDEVGAMADALVALRDAALRARELEAEAEAQRRLVEEERGRAEAERRAAALQQEAVVVGLADGLARLAGGDLTCHLDTAFAAEYEKLRADFNDAIAQLQSTMMVIVSSTDGIRSGAGEITQAADDLSRRTEQQAANLEETAAALDEITATVRKTAEGATQARSAVSTAKADAEHSGEVVRDAVAAMSEIEKSAQQISQIIGVIDEIAFQTNLLALNAGVEAARAGEAGRGFAVVASEVRALAQRSAAAAKEIKSLISTSTRQVTRGVGLVGETGQALSRIVLQVAQINGVVAEIAASAQEQATGLQEVNTAINQMDQMTQQNAAMVEESTAASHSLARETEELGRLTSRFQLGQVSSNVTPIAAPVRRAAVKGPIPQLKTKPAARNGGAAPARKPQLDEAGWEEF
jgi:methyl-accepting chemotaxis protein